MAILPSFIYGMDGIPILLFLSFPKLCSKCLRSFWQLWHPWNYTNPQTTKIPFRQFFTVASMALVASQCYWSSISKNEFEILLAALACSIRHRLSVNKLRIVTVSKKYSKFWLCQVEFAFFEEYSHDFIFWKQTQIVARWLLCGK